MPRLLEPEWFVQINSAVVGGAKVFFYTTGTTTKITTFSDAALTVANTNPIICDANGKIGDVFTAGSLKVKIVVAPSNDTDPPTAPINTYDPVTIGETFDQGLNTTDDVTFDDITATGVVLKGVAHPIFLTNLPADDLNGTGDGTTRTIPFSDEITDQGGNISGATLTASPAGAWGMGVYLDLSGFTSSHTSLTITIATSNRSYLVCRCNPFAMNAGARSVYGGYVDGMDFDDLDTATIELVVSGGTKVIDVEGGSSSILISYWFGKLTG